MLASGSGVTRSGPRFERLILVQRITSRQNPIVRTFRDAATRATDDLLLIEARHLIDEAVGAGLHIDALAMTAHAREREQAALERLSAHVEAAGGRVIEVSPEVMKVTSPVRTPAGVVALASLPTVRAEAMFESQMPWVIVAADIQDPGNVGAIVRVAEAAGASGVWFTGASAHPLSWKAVRGSMGSIFRLPVARTSSTEGALERCRSHGLRIVATAPLARRTMDETLLTGAVAVVLGGEGHGLPESIRTVADEEMRIPMSAPVESLNVATAAAVVAYEMRRQRTAAMGLESPSMAL
jgi:TrmH family RNA methyltransferase